MYIIKIPLHGYAHCQRGYTPFIFFPSNRVKRREDKQKVQEKEQESKARKKQRKNIVTFVRNKKLNVKGNTLFGLGRPILTKAEIITKISYEKKGRNRVHQVKIIHASPHLHIFIYMSPLRNSSLNSRNSLLTFSKTS